MRKIYISLFILVLLLVGFVFFKSKTVKVVNGDYLNTTYKIDGQEIKLVNGKFEMESAPGSSSKTVVRYFGNEVRSDLDDDGREDVAFILTEQTGGSGTFYYLVAALNKEGGFVGSDSVLLGDRIAPQSTSMGKGNVIVVNYAVRKPEESFAVAPSIGKSMWLLLDPGTMQFGEVAQNFEGEADPSIMNLNMQPWTWVSTVYGDNREVKPVGSKSFVLTFNKDESFSATTDCNAVGGEYLLKDNKITFTRMTSTLMYCENSQESDFVKMLVEIESYHFTTKGELIFDLKFDSGSMVFK